MNFSVENENDELQMRDFFADSATFLYTRSLKNGEVRQA